MALDIMPISGVWTGPAFPFRYGVMGVLGPKSDDEVLATAIQVILKTRVGSWRPDPSFGSHLWDLIFDPLDSVTTQLVQYYTVKDLADNLPYIEVQGVSVAEFPAQHLVEVKIAYVRQSDPTGAKKQTAVIFDKQKAA